MNVAGRNDMRSPRVCSISIAALFDDQPWGPCEGCPGDLNSDGLVDALDLAPDYPQAQWWLANVRFLGLGDAAGAVGPLEDLLNSDDLPVDVRQGAELMLQEARGET